MSTVTITDRKAITDAETLEDRENLIEITNTIRRQVSGGVMMSLGAHGLIAYYETLMRGEHGSYLSRPTLAFYALILPFLKSGERGSRPRKMLVTVTLNGNDYYDVKVVFDNGDDGMKEHFSMRDVDAYSLPRVLLALDYDGDEVLNPRYA